LTFLNFFYTFILQGSI